MNALDYLRVIIPHNFYQSPYKFSSSNDYLLQTKFCIFQMPLSISLNF